MPQTNLQAVVAAVASRLPAVERRELRLIVLERSTGGSNKAPEVVGAGAGASRETECVQDLQSQCFIAQSRVVEVIHILGGSRIRWSARGGAGFTAGPRCLGKQVFPIRNRRNRVFGGSRISRFR